MRVRAIHCSNILSFKRAEDFSKDKTTIRLLATNKPQGAMHLLIGPNGSGKTNFMTILKTVLTKYIMPACEYFPQYRNDLEKRKQTLLLHKPTWNLSPHRAYQDKPQQIELELELTDRDLQHIQTLRDHKEELATAISTYSNISDIDPKRRSKPGQTRPQRYVTITISAEGTSWTCGKQGRCSRLTYAYIRYYNILQYCLDLVNTDTTFQELPTVRRPITAIDADRSYGLTTDLFDQPRTLLDQQINETHRDLIFLLQLDIPIYRITKTKLQRTYQHLRTKGFTPQEAVKRTNKLDRLIKLNTQMDGLIHYRLTCTVENDELTCRCVDTTTGRSLQLHELAGGEQTIIHILFELYTKDLRETIMIVEEPELHVHPYLQRKLLKLFERTAKKRGIQYIITTHSPFFITHQTITHLIRFQKHHDKEGSYTAVYKPNRLTIKEKNLIKALDYNIAANIFFVDKAIIVEGPDDHYFFEKHINDWGSTHPKQPDIRHFGIFQLNGKHMFPQFQRFLAQYGLKTYYIGDRDNISNIAHIDYYPYREELKTKRNRPARRQIKYHYEELVTYIKTTYPDLYQTIINKIQSLSKYDIYILQQGSIESYVDTKKKGLDEMIAFCKYRYEQRKENPAFAHKRAELNRILEDIFLRT